jgi:hypothetical protein
MSHQRIRNHKHIAYRSLDEPIPISSRYFVTVRLAIGIPWACISCASSSSLSRLLGSSCSWSIACSSSSAVRCRIALEVISFVLARRTCSGRGNGSSCMKPYLSCASRVICGVKQLPDLWTNHNNSCSHRPQTVQPVSVPHRIPTGYRLRSCPWRVMRVGTSPRQGQWQPHHLACGLICPRAWLASLCRGVPLASFSHVTCSDAGRDTA